jgi:hypothetical protein
MTEPTDWIQYGVVSTTHPDGHVTREHLNAQGLATTATADKLRTWLDENIPEGREWIITNNHVNGGSVIYNCPCWMAVAQNGFQVNAGNCWYNLFYYPDPTPAQVEELHKGASAQPAT